jgi:amidase
VASGAVTPGELLDLALAQHRRVNGSVNAVVRLMEEQARQQVTGPLKRPFAGVPFLIKDGVQDYAGVPTTYGCRRWRGVFERKLASPR